jgi:spore coat protein H
MRKNIIMLPFVLLTALIVHCGGSSNEVVTDPPIPSGDPKPTYLYLYSDKPVILCDGIDSITLTSILCDQYGNKIDDAAIAYYSGNSRLASNNFSINSVGEYSLRAVYQDLESNRVKIKAKTTQTLTQLTLETSVRLIEADNNDEIKLYGKPLDQDGDLISGQNIDYYTNATKLSGSKFKTSTTGLFQITAKTGAFTSNTVSIKAIKTFDISKLHRMEIVISKDEWDGMSKDMLDYDKKFPVDFIYCQWRTGNYRKAKLVYRDVDGDFDIDNIAIRTRGNTTRILPQDQNGKFHRTGFNIKFDKPFGVPVYSNEYNDMKKRSVLNINELNLKTYYKKWYDESKNIHYTWANPVRINELYSYDLFNKANVYAPRATSVKLALRITGYESNGADKVLDYGIYFAFEEVDKKFITKRLGKVNNAGDLYKCLYQQGGPATLETLPSDDNTVLEKKAIIGKKDWTRNFWPTYDINTNESTTDHGALKNFIKNLNTLQGQEFKNYMDANFDVDMFLRQLAIDLLLGDPDGYRGNGNNYYLYFNPNGKIIFIPYDLDHSVGSSSWYPFDMKNADIYSYFSNLNTIYTLPLVEKILSVPEYKAAYEGYLSQYTDPLNGIFKYDKFEQYFNSLKSIYVPVPGVTDYFTVSDEAELVYDTGYVMHDNGDQMYPYCIPPYYDNNGNEIVPGWASPGQPLTIADYFAAKIASVRGQLGL